MLLREFYLVYDDLSMSDLKLKEDIIFILN